MPICFKKVSKFFAQEKIIEDFSITFPEHGCICLLGPPGIGKTTLLNLISSILNPDLGEITGLDNKKISYLFQDDRIFMNKTALENVSIVIKGKDFSLAKAYLNKVGFTNEYEKKVKDLSGGMKRKVAIARALAYDGDIFIFDEPFKSLDLISIKKIEEIIKFYKKQKLIILVTHNEIEARKIADILYFLKGNPLNIEESLTLE